MTVVSRLTSLVMVVLAAAPLWAAPGKEAAPAADEALALIPPRAVAVVQINGIDRVQNRLDKLLQAAVPDRAAEMSKSLRDNIAQALAGRDTKGIVADGRVLIAIADIEKLP